VRSRPIAAARGLLYRTPATRVEPNVGLDQGDGSQESGGSMNDVLGSEKCATCFGEGALFRDLGPETCPDCCGLGELPSASVLRERRLRELEHLYARRTEDSRDVRWLIAEVRRSQHALLQILAASQEVGGADAIAQKIRFLANDVLGLYRPRTFEE